MRWKTTVVLLIATIGIGAYLSLYEIRQPTREEHARLANQVVRVSAEDTTQLVLDLPNVKATLTRQGTTWRINPQQLRANPVLVNKLLGALDPLMANRILLGSSDHPLDPKSYGLDPAVGWMSVVSPAGPTTLLIGETTPVAGNRYVQIKGRPEIFIVSARLFDDANQVPEQFRDPLLLRFDAWQADGLSVSATGRSLTLARTPRGWQIASTGPTGPGPQSNPDQPWSDVADRTEVNSLLQHIARVSIARFLEETPQVEQVAAYGFDQPRAEVTLRRKDASSVTVFFGKPLPDHNSLLYAKRSDEPALYAVSNADIEALVRDPHGLRSKPCFDFFTNEVSKLEVVWEGARWMMERAEGRWKTEGAAGPLDEARVEEFLNDVVDLRLGGFVDDAPKDLVRYGLEPPKGALTVWTVADPPPQRLLVGSTIEPSTNRYGRIDGRAAIVRLPETITEVLAKTLDSLSAPAPSKTQPALHPIGTGTSPPPAAPSK